MLNLLGPVKAVLACFFPVTQIQAFKELVSLEKTTKSSYTTRLKKSLPQDLDILVV